MLSVYGFLSSPKNLPIVAKHRFLTDKKPTKLYLCTAMLNHTWEVQLQQLRAELILMKDSIKETSADIIKGGFSSHPIFIAHQEDIEIGEVILDKTDMSTHWSISASTLEDFVEKGVVPADKADYFKENYKSPKDFICMFVIHGNDARFVFIPYRATALDNN